MRNWNITPLVQGPEYGCGPCSLAMLANVSVESAMKVCRAHGWSDEDGVSHEGLARAFGEFGLKLMEAEKITGERRVLFDRRDDGLLCGPILNPIKKSEWTDNDTKVRISIEVEGPELMNNKLSIKAADHWAVWDGKEQVVRDPYGYRAMFVPIYFYRLEPK